MGASNNQHHTGHYLRHSRLRYGISNQYYIRFYRYTTNTGLFSTFLFLLLTLLILTPLDLSGERSLAASGDTSTTSLTLATSGSAELGLLVTSDSGTFASNGTPLEFNVSTNNYTGYTVSIRAKENTTDLTNTTSGGGSFTSISGSGITSEAFDTPTYNGHWGIKPNYYDSNANADKFYPSPDTSGITLNRTESANAADTSDSYSIGIAARATYAQAAGTYTNTYILNAIGNYPAYTITYDANGGSGAPDTQSATSIANTSVQVILRDTEPTRTGYTFGGWCTENTATCPNDKTYQPGDTYTLDTVNSNTVKLYAIWTINQYDCIKRYRTQTATGGWSDYTTESTTKVNYNETCTYTKTLTNYKPSASGTNNSQATTSGTVTTSGVTLNLSFYRNTYTLTVNRNSTYISSASATTSAVHGTNYYRWGQSVSISATASSGNKFTSWSQTAGTEKGTFASASSASTTFAMPKNNATIYANGAADKIYMQTMSASQCTTTPTTVYDNRDETSYVVQKLADNKCWMLENLAFDAVANKDRITASNTNIESGSATAILTSLKSGNRSAGDQYSTNGITTNYSQNYSVPTIAISGACSGIYCANDPSYGYWQSSATIGWGADVSSITIDGQSVSKGKIGVYYNFCAASAGSYCYGIEFSEGTSSGSATSDICPYNWRLPTGNTNGEFQAIYNNYSSDSLGQDKGFVTALRLPLSGALDQGRALYQNDTGFWWSSTRQDNRLMYRLQVTASGVYPAYGSYRYYGYPVRCVLRASS